MGSSYTVPAAQTRILLVDDYPDGLEVWSLYLRMCGYEVFTASDGVAALEEVRLRKPAIAILDLELPRMSGIDAARQLRTDPETAGMPLIAITGHSEARRLDEARQAGFDLILVKPCDPDRLREEIQRLLTSPDLGANGMAQVTLNRQIHPQSD
jgi:CheY-like chemotaxis protein